MEFASWFMILLFAPAYMTGRFCEDTLHFSARTTAMMAIIVLFAWIGFLLLLCYHALTSIILLFA
jgi:hypothetical protein